MFTYPEEELVEELDQQLYAAGGADEAHLRLYRQHHPQVYNTSRGHSVECPIPGIIVVRAILYSTTISPQRILVEAGYRLAGVIKCNVNQCSDGREWWWQKGN